MSNTKQLRKEWIARISRNLLGRKIIAIKYISEEECDDLDWCSCPVAIKLEGDIWLVPMSDDEGNDGGALATNIKQL